MAPAFPRISQSVAAGLFTAAICVGCNGVTGPATSLTSPGPVPLPAPTPTPAPATTALLWGMVINPGGACIENATVQVVSGQRQGESQVQDPACDAWGYSGGFLFKDLTPGVPMTLRASAPGWTTQEQTFMPFPIPGSYVAVFLELSRE